METYITQEQILKQEQAETIGDKVTLQAEDGKITIRKAN